MYEKKKGFDACGINVLKACPLVLAKLIFKFHPITFPNFRKKKIHYKKSLK
jgi:hypothetical protein